MVTVYLLNQKFEVVQILFTAAQVFRVPARHYLLSEDVVRLENFQKMKLAVARQVSGSKGWWCYRNETLACISARYADIFTVNAAHNVYLEKVFGCWLKKKKANLITF